MASAPEVPSSLGEGVLLVLQRSLLGFLLRGRSHAAPSGSGRIEPHRPPWSSPQGRRSPDPIPPAATVSCQARLLQSQRVGTRPSTWLQYARHRGRRRPVRKLPTCLAAPEDPLPDDREVPPVASGASAAFQPSPGRCVSTEPQANYWLSSQGPQRGNARSKAAPGSNLLRVPASFLE